MDELLHGTQNLQTFVLRLAAHLVAHVNLGEAEGAEVWVGALHRRLDGLSEQLVHKLADERPHLLHRLDRKGVGITSMISQSNQT